MVAVNSSMDNNLQYISNTLDSLNMDVLYIFSIYVDNSIELKVFELEQSSNIKYVKVGIKFFMENYLDNSNNNF